MAMLTQSVREQSRAVGTSPSADFRLERSADAYSQRHRTGATGTFRFGGFLVQAFPPDAKTSATPLRAVCREALAILRLNRLAGEIATY